MYSVVDAVAHAEQTRREVPSLLLCMGLRYPARKPLHDQRRPTSLVGIAIRDSMIDYHNLSQPMGLATRCAGEHLRPPAQAAAAGRADRDAGAFLPQDDEALTRSLRSRGSRQFCHHRVNALAETFYKR